MRLSMLQSAIYKRNSQSVLTILGGMLFFWILFDGGFSYLVPLVITHSGYSKTTMGLILASSSVFGALFDMWLSKYTHTVHFKRMFFCMFGLSFLAPLYLMNGYPLILFLVAMAVWGCYYDLSNFALLDFVSRKVPGEKHASSFGYLSIFRGLGEALAPLLMGILVVKAITIASYIFLYFLLIISFLFYLVFLMKRKSIPQEYFHTVTKNESQRYSEVFLWKQMGRLLFPVLLLIFLFWIFDAFFWSIGPLMSQTFTTQPILGVLFLTAYACPSLIVGLLVGVSAKRIGKKRTAQTGFFFASLLFLFLFWIKNPFVILLLIFIASVALAFCIPALSSAFADYIAEAPQYEKEIEALQDFSTNMGYIFGPIIAGVLADTFGNIQSFAYLGLLGIIVLGITFFITPKQIQVKVS